jgi:PAS domain S-box-containing protein
VVLLSADEFRIKYMSAAYRRYLPEALKDKDIIGVRFIDYARGGASNPSVPVLRRISERGKGEEIRDYLLKTRDGVELWVDWVGSPIDNGTDRWDVLLQLRDITDRRRAEEALKEANDELEEKVQKRTRELSESESFLQGILDHASDAMFVKDRSGRMRMANPAFYRLMGIPPEKVLGKVVADYHNQEVAKAIERDERRVMETGVAETIEERVLTSHGWKFLQTTKAPHRDSEGRIVGYIGIARDITEHKETERALQESEAQFRQLFNSTVDAIFIHDLEGRFLAVNDIACSRMGYSREELLSMGLKDINVPEQANMIPGRMEEVVRNGQAIFETVDMTIDGRRIPTEVSSRIITFQGRPAYLSIARDITERKKKDMVLEESEEKYRGLFDNIKEGVSLRRFIFDEQGEIVDAVIIDANPAALKVYGASSIDQLRGKSYSDIASPEMRAAALDVVKRMRATDKPVTEEEHSDVNDRDYLVTAAPLGKDLVITTSFDITDRKKMEDELRRSNAELQQFAYVASHDLKEPLRMVTSYLGLLNRKCGPNLEEDARGYMQFAMDGAERMSEMIDDLLAYSRVETSGSPFGPVEMDEVLTVALKDLRVSIEESGASITHDALPTIMADRVQMTQVIRNLIANAIKYRGLATPQIHVSARGDGRKWVFSVSDNGIGIDPKFGDKLFQMFQRLHTREEYEGTGMGLAISKKIVERHGGRIWFESEVDKGTTFHFTIPVRSKG